MPKVTGRKYSIGAQNQALRVSFCAKRLAIDKDLRGRVCIASGEKRLIRSSGKGRMARCLLLEFLFGLVVASHVLLHAVEDVVLENAQNQVEPEEVHGLQTGQQGEGDDLTDPTFVLLGLPVELVGSNGAEFGQHGPEDLQVEYVAAVDPHNNEGAKVWYSDDGVEIVEGFRGLR